MELKLDRRLKKDIVPLSNAVSKLSKITGVSYHWKSPEADLSEQVGVIAQDVQKVYPQLVSTEANGTLGVNYAGLVAPLIEAVKELKADNENLRAQLKAANDNQAAAIEELRREINALKVGR